MRPSPWFMLMQLFWRRVIGDEFGQSSHMVAGLRGNWLQVPSVAL